MRNSRDSNVLHPGWGCCSVPQPDYAHHRGRLPDSLELLATKGRVRARVPHRDCDNWTPTDQRHRQHCNHWQVAAGQPVVRSHLTKTQWGPGKDCHSQSPTGPASLTLGLTAHFPGASPSAPASKSFPFSELPPDLLSSAESTNSL